MSNESLEELTQRHEKERYEAILRQRKNSPIVSKNKQRTDLLSKQYSGIRRVYFKNKKRVRELKHKQYMELKKLEEDCIPVEKDHYRTLVELRTLNPDRCKRCGIPCHHEDVFECQQDVELNKSDVFRYSWWGVEFTPEEITALETNMSDPYPILKAKLKAIDAQNKV